MMDACSSLLATPAYGFGAAAAAGAFDAYTPPPAPSEAARRALFSGWPNYPAVTGDPTPLGPRAPPSTFSAYTPSSAAAPPPPYGSAFADIAAFGASPAPPPPPPQRTPHLSAFYPGAAAAANGYGDSGYGYAPHPHPSQHGEQQQQPAASSAAVAAALHGSRLLLSDLQTAAAAVGAMPPPPPPPRLTCNSRYDAVDPLCYLNDVVSGSVAHTTGIYSAHLIAAACSSAANSRGHCMFQSSYSSP